MDARCAELAVVAMNQREIQPCFVGRERNGVELCIDTLCRQRVARVRGLVPGEAVRAGVSRRLRHMRPSWMRRTLPASGHCALKSTVSDAILQPVSLPNRSEEHTSELQSLMRISYAVFCLKKKKK